MSVRGSVFRFIGKILKWFVVICALLAALIAFGTDPLFLEDAPLVTEMSPPSPEDVATTRKLVQDIRTAGAGAGPADTYIQTDAQQLNSAIRLGARFIDGFRGQVDVLDEDVAGAVSIPVTWWTGQKWLNVSGRAPEFEGAFVVSEVKVGATELPPAIALGLARVAANIGIGNNIGDTVLSSASAMQITSGGVAIQLNINEMGKNGVMQSAFGTLRGAEMPTSDEVEIYHILIRNAMEDGTLSQTGSFVPYLRFTIEAALEGDSSPVAAQRYTAAVLGLAKACGASDFSEIVGRLVFDKQQPEREWTASCKELTLNGRIDSRRHFVTSAALQAASNTGFSMSVGEFKELYDTISGAGGFDFTDLGANLSGIAMSDVFMQNADSDWSDLLMRIVDDSDVIVGFEGIPSLMPKAEFQREYGDIDSPAYNEMVSQIQDRVRQLTLHQPL